MRKMSSDNVLALVWICCNSARPPGEDADAERATTAAGVADVSVGTKLAAVAAASAAAAAVALALALALAV